MKELAAAIIYITVSIETFALFTGSIWLYGWCGWSGWWIVFAAIMCSGTCEFSKKFIKTILK